MALIAGSIYFAMVFAAGFALGVLRTLVLEPGLGAVSAVLVELPIILGVAWVACARVLRRIPLSGTGPVVMGTAAFVLLMLAEAGLSVLLAGRSLAQHFALYRDAPHLLGLAGQVLFAAFPWIQARRARPA